MRNIAVITFILSMALLASACAEPPELSIENAWARPAFQGDNGAVYLVINNHTDQGDGLIGADSYIANLTEIHLNKMDPQGIMTMERQDLVGIPANESVELAPGGLHVMLVDLLEDLNVGDKFELTLMFQRSGDIMVEVEVRQP